MSQNIQAQEWDELSNADYHRDGLLDIFMGLGIALAGLFMWADMVFMLGVIPVTIMPAWQLARKGTLKRMGLEDVPLPQKVRTRLVLLITLLMGALLLLFGLGIAVAFYFESLPASYFDWLHQYFVLILAGIMALALAFCGWLLGLRRLYVYALAALLILAGGQALRIDLPFSLSLYGGLVFLSGLVILVRFLQSQPGKE